MRRPARVAHSSQLKIGLRDRIADDPRLPMMRPTPACLRGGEPAQERQRTLLGDPGYPERHQRERDGDRLSQRQRQRGARATRRRRPQTTPLRTPTPAAVWSELGSRSRSLEGGEAAARSPRTGSERLDAVGCDSRARSGSAIGASRSGVRPTPRVYRPLGAPWARRGGANAAQRPREGEMQAELSLQRLGTHRRWGPRGAIRRLEAQVDRPFGDHQGGHAAATGKAA